MSTGTLGAILENPWCLSGALQLTGPMVATAGSLRYKGAPDKSVVPAGCTRPTWAL